MLAEARSSSNPSHGDWFTTTHWSVVLAAGEADSPAAREALEELCQSYWYPLYVYVRRQGYSPEDAKDLTQGFFERILGRAYFHRLDRSKGKFRAFLLAALKHFLADQRDRQCAAKRGGGNSILSLEALRAEELYQAEPIQALPPDILYDRQWAFSVMECASERLRQEFVAEGKTQVWEELKQFIKNPRGEITYLEIGQKLGRSETAIKSIVLRLRQRYGELVRDEIARTVANVAEVDEEIRYLLAVLSA